MDPNESNAAKLRRLGSNRVNKALNDLKLVGNLAAYAPDPEHEERIMQALTDGLKEVEMRFKARRRGSERSFTL